jgi:hypothetical protein
VSRSGLSLPSPPNTESQQGATDQSAHGKDSGVISAPFENLEVSSSGVFIDLKMDTPRLNRFIKA